MRMKMVALLTTLALMPVCAYAGETDAPSHDREKMEITAAMNSKTLAVMPLEAEEQQIRVAAARTETGDGTAKLFAQPDEQADVLMEYYSGAPLEIVRPVGGKFYQVQAGDEEASVMGYIRAQNLAVGSDAARQIRPCFMKLEFNREAQVHAYCDEGAQIIGICEPGKTYYAMSKNEEKWVQLFLPPQPHLQEEEERMTRGFVHLETGMARGYWQELHHWEVQPMSGDISREQAAELAIAYLESGEQFGIPEVYKNRTELESMEHRAYLSMMEGGEHPTAWFVYFWEKEGNDAVYVILSVSNGELLTASQSYISSDSWSAYAVEPVL